MKLHMIMESFLVEGQGDQIVNNAIQAVRNRKEKSVFNEINIEDAIDDAKKLWQKTKNTKGTQETPFPNKWKVYLAHKIRDLLYKGTGIKELFDKAKTTGNLGVMNINVLLNALVHFSGVPYPPIQNFNPLEDVEKYENPIDHLNELQREWIEEKGGKSIKAKGDEKMILDLGKFKWFDLGRGACEDEANSMGHCGNAPSEREGDTILSLRRVEKKGDETHHTPVLTFISNNGVLGEMKGRANEKPAKRYHKYIVELLKSPHVKGLAGGGYEQENNFDPSDLTEKERKEIAKVKGEEFLEVSQSVHIREVYKEFKENPTESVFRKMCRVTDEVIEYIMEEADFEYAPIHVNPIEVTGKSKDDKMQVFAKLHFFNTLESVKLFNDPDGFAHHDLGEAPSRYYDIEAYLPVQTYREVVDDIIDSYKPELEDYFGEFPEDREEAFNLINNNIEGVVHDITQSLKAAVDVSYSDAYERSMERAMIDEIEDSMKELEKMLNVKMPEDYSALKSKDYMVPVKDNNVVKLVKGVEEFAEHGYEDMYEEHDTPRSDYTIDDDIFMEFLPDNISMYFG